MINTLLISKLRLESNFSLYNYGVIFLELCYLKIQKVILKWKREEDKKSFEPHNLYLELQKH